MLTFSEMLIAYDRTLDDITVLASGAGDLTASTPCAGWDLADLFGHMVGQNLGFAAAVADGDAPADAYESVPVAGDEPIPGWAAVARKP